MAQRIPDSAVERGPASPSLDSWWDESDLGRRRRGRGAPPIGSLGGALGGAVLLAYGALLGIGALFGGIIATLELWYWPGSRTVVAWLAFATGLMAAGAWLAFELSESEGLGTSVEWAPDSPP